MNNRELALPADVVDAELVDHDLVPWHPEAGQVVAVALSSGAERRRRNAHSDNTIRAYERHARRYETWCLEHNQDPWQRDPDGIVLAEYVNHLADVGASRSNINQAIAAVRTAFTKRGLSKPAYDQAREVRDGYLREATPRRTRRAKPLTVRAMRSMIEDTPDTAAGLRDRLLLALGFGMFARRSELAGVRLADVAEHDHGLVVYIPKSKTDQLGAGAEVNILAGNHEATDPVRLLRRWLALLAERGADVSPGAPLLRAVDQWDNVSAKPLTGKGVNDIIKRLAGGAELAGADGYSGHSLRSGAATEASRAGAPDQAIADGGRWQSDVWRRYVRAEDQWRDHPLQHVGL